MASVVMVAFGRLNFGQPYATDRPGQLRSWQLFRARWHTASQAVTGPTAACHQRQPEAEIQPNQQSKQTRFQRESYPSNH